MFVLLPQRKGLSIPGSLTEVRFTIPVLIRPISLGVLLVNKLNKPCSAVLFDLLAVLANQDRLVLIEGVLQMADSMEAGGADDKPLDFEGAGGLPVDCLLPVRRRDRTGDGLHACLGMLVFIDTGEWQLLT